MIDYLKPLQAAFEQNANAENAAAMLAYMKGQFAFYGIKSPDRREITKNFLAEYGQPVPFDPEVFQALWNADEREYQMFGLDLLRKQAKKSEKADIGLIEWLITTKSWWDTVDGLANWVCGPYFQKYPEQLDKIIPEWVESENMWLRRSSIIFQLGYKGKTDFDLLKKNIELNLGSKEFFINKAIGWSLREYGKSEPELVNDYAELMKEKFHPLSYREAMKNL